MEKKSENNEHKILKIIPPTQKGVRFPESLKWLTVNPKPHKLNEAMLSLEIEGLEESIKKLKEELSLLRKRKHKELINPPNVEHSETNDNKHEKFEKELPILNEEPRKKYQKTRRVCPCCQEIVIRHFCPHTFCEENCPIKLAYLKKKIKMEAMDK